MALGVLFEHPEWQKPLFAALERRGVPFHAIDLKAGAFDVAQLPSCSLYFNQASPSAYLRGSLRAVPYAMALIRQLELRGSRVLNGSAAFSLELSKSSQGALCSQLSIDHPATLAFNDVEAALVSWSRWPALLKPEQGGSGARMFKLAGPDELREVFRLQPDLWSPDHLMLLQELLDFDPTRGIVRMEFLGSDLLYAMRVVSHGAFNLCPSEVCHPVGDEAGICAVPSGPPVEFYAYPEVPAEAVEIGQRLMAAGGLDVGGIEYAETTDGRRVVYDINANSNLRPAIAQEFGFDPFERVVDYLAAQMSGN